jgi:hypothetical protein
MRKAKIYKPAKTAMQSGRGKSHLWVLEYEKLNTGINPLTGWQTSHDTLSEIKLEFDTKEHALSYVKKNNINYYIVESNERKLIKKSYSDNFTKVNR